MIIVLITIGIIVILTILFVRWHLKWLDKQSPLGVWTAEYKGSHITIQFEKDPSPDEKEGVYKQITKRGENEELKEFGHWWSHRQVLRMLILACEIPNHPRFGQDTIYSISYTGDNEIRIDGPDRPHLVFTKAPEGTTVEFPEEKGVEQKYSGDGVPPPQI